MDISLASLSTMLELFGAVLFGVAAAQDIAVRLVPNAVPLAIAGSGAALRALDGSLPLGVAASGAVFVTAALCWRRGWLGGADVKLFGAGALLVPPGLAFSFVLTTCLAGGVLSVAYLVAGKLAASPAPVRPAGLVARVARLERRRLRRGGPLPYAVALMAGALITLIEA